MIRAAAHRRSRGDRGAAAVEFAIVSIPLLALLLGIIQFGFVFYFQISVTQSAREAARAASLQVPCDTSCEDAIAAKVQGESGLKITVLFPGGSCAVGSNQSTSVTAKVTSVVPTILPLSNFNTSSQASMPCGG